MKITKGEAIILRLGDGEVDRSPTSAKRQPAGLTESPPGSEVLSCATDPLCAERAWRAIDEKTLDYGRRGPAVHAMSGVATALWDICGLAAGACLETRAVFQVQEGLNQVTGLTPDGRFLG